MRRTLAYPAVRDDVITLLQPFLPLVDRPQGCCILEAAIRIRRPRPRNASRSLDVSPAQSAFLRIIRHVGALTRVLLRRPHIDQRSARRRVLGDLFEESADFFVGPFGRRVLGGAKRWYFRVEGTAFLLPLDAPVIEHLGVG